MTTVNELIDETQDLLYGSYRIGLDTLAVTMDASVNTLTLTDVPVMRVNSILTLDTEDLLVRSWDPTAKVATVIRGWRSAKAAHIAGTVVEVNPRWTRNMLSRQLYQTIQAWPNSLFSPSIVQVPITDATAYVTIDAATYPRFRSVLRVGWKRDDKDLTWHWFPYWRQRPDPTGVGTHVELGELVEDGTVAVQMANDFNLGTWTTTTDLVTDVGLAVSMLDIPPMGVVAKLLPNAEVLRTNRQAQGEPRIATESPAGHAIQSSRDLRALYRQRVADEMTRLRQLYVVGTW